MTPRVIVHAGFHKTGTSTVQQTLRAHRDALAPLWRLGLEDDFADAAASGRAYSVRGEALDLGLFQGAMADWLAGLDLRGAEGLLISCESLAGEIPGRIGGAPDYRRGQVLLPALIAAIRAVLGHTPVHVHLSTRAAAGWIESLHWQLTRGGLVDEDHAAFDARIRPAADLAAQARAIAAAIAPDPLTHRALEDCHGLPEGPLTPILDLMDLPPALRAALADLTQANARPTRVDRIALADRFGEINRAGHTRQEGMRLKRAILGPVWAAEAQAAVEAQG